MAWFAALALSCSLGSPTAAPTSTPVGFGPPAADALPLRLRPISEPSPESNPESSHAPSPNASPALQLAAPVPAPTATPAGTDAPPKRRLGKGRGYLLGGSLAYLGGSALIWGTAHLGGAFEPDRPRGRVEAAPVVGATVGGIAMLQGVMFTGFAGRELARHAPDDARKSRAFRAGGGTLLALGGVALGGGVLMWPSLRNACAHGAACGLGLAQSGGAMLAAGSSLVAYGTRIQPWEDRPPRLDRKIQTMLAAGTGMLGIGYFSSLIVGFGIWQGAPDDPAARRTRNRMAIPVAGPWIHAAGPDAPVAVALVAGGLGALQIGGAMALAIAGGSAIHHRRLEMKIAPQPGGLAVAGRF